MAYETLIIFVVLSALVILGIIALVLWIVKRVSKNDIDILKRRLVKGEITQEQFDELRKKLE
ncbi:MAG TPA: SHOCT domain-containing protein [Nitrosopumilaceae archaeon]|jgi:uncharacterized membrane protein|nr:SHOCT domain-containing protein [Nitrosopumilaceae archaeon]